MIVWWLVLAFICGAVTSLIVVGWGRTWWREVPDLELDLIAEIPLERASAQHILLAKRAMMEIARRREIADLQVRSN